MSEMTLREKITACAKAHDADIVCFGSAADFGDTDVPEIFPGARTVICLGFRVLRGSHLGIEEGSTFYQYMTTGVETIEETVMPGTLLRVSALLEDAGYMAYPQRKHQTVVKDPEGVNPEADWRDTVRGTKERMLDMSEMAVRCGGGERGLSGSVLTDRFGPFVRWCCILTDAVIEPTERQRPHLCDRCGACIAACPGKALEEDGTRSDWQCAAYYQGANRSGNPFMPPDAYEGLPNREAIQNGTAKLSPGEAKTVMEATFFYPPAKNSYVPCICGRACDTACYAALEARGVLKKTVKRPYRTREPWILDT